MLAWCSNIDWLKVHADPNAKLYAQVIGLRGSKQYLVVIMAYE